MTWHPPRLLVLSWAGLLLLLGMTVLLAYQPLGSLNTVIALLIASAKALLVAAVFMELRHRRGLTLAFAAAGFFWLGILFWLSLTDYATRPEFPPRGPEKLDATTRQESGIRSRRVAAAYQQR